MERGSEALSLLRKLISINSVFPRERKLAMFCAAYLRGCGFAARLQKFAPGRFNVIAQKGPRRGSVLLSAHLDTVPPYNYGRRNPFRMEMASGRIRGLGSWDMKSGLVLVLLCAKYCRPGGKGLRIILTSDEENISEGTWAAQKRGEYRDCSVAICHEIPDAENTGARGRPPLIFGRRGRCVYHFSVKGIGSHGAGQGGVSAVVLAMRLAALLESLPMPRSSRGACRLFVRKLHSESTSLAVPTEASVEADVHYTPPFSPSSFLSYLKGKLRRLSFPKGCSWSVEIPGRKTPYLPAYETSLDTAQARKFLSAYSRLLGKPSISYGLTVADENVLSVERIPVITLGPKGGGAHSSAEWLSKSDFLLLAEKVPLIVQDMLG